MIITLIIFFVFCIVMVIIKSHQPKQSKKPSDIHKVIKLNIDLSQPAKSQEYYEKRRKRLSIRGARLDRHRRIWSVLFLTNTIYQIEENKDYIDQQLLLDLNNARAAVLENKPTRSDIETAIKFCKIEYERGKCLHKLTLSDIETIMNIYSIAQQPSTIPPN